MKIIKILKKYKFYIIICLILLIGNIYYKPIEGYSNVRNVINPSSNISKYLQKFTKNKNKKKNNNNYNPLVTRNNKNKIMQERLSSWGRVVKKNDTKLKKSFRERGKGNRWRGDKNKKRNGLAGRERGGFGPRGGRRL